MKRSDFEFRNLDMQNPGGWPKGDYKVEIFLNDAPAPAVTRTFKVG